MTTTTDRPTARVDDGGDVGSGASDPEPDADDPGRARSQSRHNTLIALFTWIRNIGALIILFAAWQLWGTAIAQHHSQQSLASQFHAAVHASDGHSSTSTLASATARLPVAPSGAVVALLQIPRIGLDQYVVSGTAEGDLAMGPGHYIGTAEPGQAGNVAIAGHRTTHGAPFNRLNDLAPGDPIYLTDLSGQRLRYVVALAPFPVDPSNVSVLNYFGDNRLTLTTCNPPYSAAQRLIVVAAYAPGAKSGLTGHRIAAVDAGVPQKVVISGEAGWNAGLIPVVLLEVGLLIALGLTNRRWSTILGPVSRWIVLAPIWTAGLFILFQSLTGFLPAAA